MLACKTLAGVSLLERFENQTLPKEEWTHEAHVRVALDYVRSSGPGALEKMRSGILALNAVHGVETTPTGGYHETLTRVWLELVRVGWEHYGNWEALWEWLQDKRLPLQFYSRDRLMSPEARYGWLEPDLKEIACPVAP